jgi:tripartite-type tricarboxylate transporter receptor subunit TctC
VVKILKMPAIRDQLAGQGADAVGDTPEEFGHFMREEVAQWAHMVRTSGAKVD